MKMLAAPQVWRKVQRMAAQQERPMRTAAIRLFSSPLPGLEQAIATGRVSVVEQCIAAAWAAPLERTLRQLRNSMLTCLSGAGEVIAETKLVPMVPRFGAMFRINERGPRRVKVSFVFDQTSPEAIAWSQKHAGELVTGISAQQRKNVRELVTQAFAEQRTSRELAGQLKDVVGLTGPQFAKYTRLVNEDPTAAKRYAKKAWNDRAVSIARTETLRASNEGQRQAWDQATKQGLLTGQELREWITTYDDRTCPICAPMDGQLAGLQGSFRLPDGTGVSGPPAHPLCRCAQGLSDKTQKPQRPGYEDVLNQSKTYEYAPADPEGVDSLSRFMRGNGTLTPERQQLHDAIVEKHFAGVTAVDGPVSVMLGGGPASGKSMVSRKLPFQSNFVSIDPDEIKGFIPEYGRMKEGQSRLAAAYVHEESSFLSKRIASEARDRGFNIYFDTVGDGDYDKLVSKVAGMRSAGRKVIAHYVSIDVETALSRNIARAQKTGRFVPPAYIEETHAAVSRIFPRAVRDGLFDESYLWDTSTREGLQVMAGMGKKLNVLNQEAWRRFLAKGKPVAALAEEDGTPTGADAERLLREVLLKLPPSIPDSPALAALRERIKASVRDTEAGYVIDIPVAG